MKCFVDISLSLDGFTAGDVINVEQPLGYRGELLHEWFFSGKTPEAIRMQEYVVNRTGAVIAGNGTYAPAIPVAWNKQSPFKVPCIVLCHQQPAFTVSGFLYETGGIKAALERAVDIAGDKDVWIMGGANVIQQFIAAGWVDELHLHVVPVLLGKGRRLLEHIDPSAFGFRLVEKAFASEVVHLRYFKVVDHDEPD
ncbi:dihydrofolate reductase family protein [Flavihumibacter petaseus]|uniref:Bacterial bifunctional deaminase-reductase C-terminal domain-containing protein n=1 Tax=Flavihumibacter petaseus NBRC 106054 TaxID=1220578 RepID=A0A0E9N114_9BACT|nr:dihydrofolate reductase family protein [Flavihumibacter petaseus]GAO43539.1 hypothetical protein FPE01S_02_06440 [Flavihumibacter petaseus NBRC 106054]